jgi:uncharacterized membrane protein YdjX (TVP38/TMEM64 family)
MSEAEPRRRSTALRLAPLALIAAAAVLFVAADGWSHLDLAAVIRNRGLLCGPAPLQRALCSLVFVASYAGLAALSVPGAAALTLVGGFLFGTWLGASYAAIGATAGGTVVFLAARRGLSGLAMRSGGPGDGPMGGRARRIAAGFRRDAFSYLLVLRLIPVFPFWLVNLAAGATGMRLSSYVLATLLGIIPGSIIYAGLGSGLGAVIASGRMPGPALRLAPHVLLPLLGLAALALLSIGYRRWRAGRRSGAP